MLSTNGHAMFSVHTTVPIYTHLPHWITVCVVAAIVVAVGSIILGIITVCHQPKETMKQRGMTWKDALAMVTEQAEAQGVDVANFRLLATRHYGAGEQATSVTVDGATGTVRIRAAQ